MKKWSQKGPRLPRHLDTSMIKLLLVKNAFMAMTITTKLPWLPGAIAYIVTLESNPNGKTTAHFPVQFRLMRTALDRKE